MIPEDAAELFARVFRGADGDRALAVLRAVTLDRTLGPDASDAALRDLEGRRRLVSWISTLVERGRGAPVNSTQQG